MADDFRRPPADIPSTAPTTGTRARNRTMVMGADNIGQMRSQFQIESGNTQDSWTHDAPEMAEDVFQAPTGLDAQDPLGLESLDYTDPIAEEKTLQALDEIFDLGVTGPPSPTPEPELPVEENFDPTPDLPQEVEPSMRAIDEIIQPAPISVARIVRPGNANTAQTSSPPAAATVSVPQIPEAPAPVAFSEPNPSGGTLVSDKQEEIFWKAEGPLVGFLVTFDHDPRGSYVELRSGRLIVSSQCEESGNCLVIRDPSVSPMHAIMRVAQGGVVQILDQLSEAGTRIKHIGEQEEVFLSGEKATVAHGDIVFFGDRKFHVLLVLGDGE